MTCDLNTNEEGAVMSRCGFRYSLVPWLCPASVMSRRKFAGSKVTTLLLRVRLPGDEASFRSVRYLKVKIRCKNALEPRIVSAVRSLEVVACRRMPMYYKYEIVTRTLSALGSVSASRSVRSGRFYCI